jgi:ABC-type multidrug transport system fused ATPase/permease subunit
MLKKINEILVRREKLKLVFLSMGAIIMSFLGAMGVAPIMPFIALAADRSILIDNKYFQLATNWFPFLTQENVLFYTGLTVFAFIILATSSNLAFRYMMNRISWGIANTMAIRLLDNYCYGPYETFLTKDTKKMSFKILHEIHTFAVGVLTPLANFMASLFTALFLFAMLLIADWQISLAIIVCLGSSYVIIYFIFQKKVAALGEKRVGEASKRFQIAEEILQNIKTTKVFGKEKFFLNKFSVASNRFTRAQSMAPLYMQSPKALIDTITFGSIVFVVLFIDSRGGLDLYLPKLSLFALAGYRLLPALQMIYFSITDLRFHMGGLDILHKDIMELPFEIAKENKESEPPSEITYLKSIQVRDVGFSYPNASTPLFENLNLSIQKGQRVALIGATGSGKSTFVDLIMGLLTPKTGGINIDDHSLKKSDWKAWRKRVGYVPQEIYLIHDSVTKNIAFGLPDDEISEQAVKDAARIAEISEFIETEMEQGYETNVGERGIRLSGGQKQRIGLARALYHNPDVLVLDEATSALDNKTERSIMSSINNLPKELTIVMIAHRLSTVQNCDVIYVLDKGQVVDHGSYDELKYRCKLFVEIEEQHQEVN